MVQMSSTAEDGFPYGIDPRPCRPTEYERILAQHRAEEHRNVLRQQREKHDQAMAWSRAEQERLTALRAARQWWLEPVKAFSQWLGGALWVALWLLAIVGVVDVIGNQSRRSNAQACLQDLAACAKQAGPGYGVGK